GPGQRQRRCQPGAPRPRCRRLRIPRQNRPPSSAAAGAGAGGQTRTSSGRHSPLGRPGTHRRGRAFSAGDLMRVLPALLMLLTNPPPPSPPQPACEAVSYRAGKETVRGTLYRPAGKGPWPAVVVVHGEFGPTTWVKKQTARLAQQGYVSLAVDLYRG